MKKYVSGSIAVGQSKTDPIVGNSFSIIGVRTGSSVTASAFYIEASHDGVRYDALKNDSGSVVTFVTTPLSYNTIVFSNQGICSAFDFIKICSGTSASATLQSGSPLNLVIALSNLL
jgi:hypothetical protein